MGHKYKKQNPFAAKKRQKREQREEDARTTRPEPYKEITRENAAFEKFYSEVLFSSLEHGEQEWKQCLAVIRENLPSTFRVTGFRDQARALLDIIETNLFEDYVQAVAEIRGIDKTQVERPRRLPWYPNGMAYQLQLTRKDIRRSEPLCRLHNFLIVETNAGNISRQEAVSMIPPIVLDVKPTDKVLDMCAAPGSKTAQLIEALHAAPELYKIPPGFVVANDVDNNRCYMLVHQAKRLNSPCFIVTNHDSSYFPNLFKYNVDGSKGVLKFDKILCDVPCSGDGTLRKNPDIWMKWNLAQAYNLHGIQFRITRRGAEMLEVGGRLVYSTCSLNPIENEAVLQRLIKESAGALEIVDASHLVPGLKSWPGLTKWKLATKEVDNFYESFTEVPEKYHTVIRPNMFPLPEEEIRKIGLDKCIRILPHLQDTGGFFVAVIEKKAVLPFEKNDVNDLVVQLQREAEKTTQSKNVDPEHEKDASVPWGPQRKRRRMHGFKEDPYIFFDENDVDWDELKKFFDLDDELNKRCLLTRCVTEKKKNIYYCSEPIRDLVLLNEAIIKVINTGVKAFVRCENRHTMQPYRLAQEGLQTTNAFMGANRRIDIAQDDLITLLNCTDPTKPPSTYNLQETTQERCKELSVGSCILRYANQRFTLYVVGWRGSSSLRAYVDTNETIHLLRLLGADLGKFEVNKYEKAKEAALVDALPISESSSDTVKNASVEKESEPIDAKSTAIE